ncbi:hypothetical protein B0H11DRAFT_1932713 [Mycena galericulata]|nr:hypothetical protein B0H11DRAFT_1932713 [Mycena galericulata]
MSIPPRGKENSRLVSFQRGPEYFCTWGWATPLQKRRTRAGNRAHIGNRLSFCRTPSPSAATSRNPSRPQNLQTTQPPSLSMLPEPPPGLIEALKLRYFLIHGQAHPTEGPGMERYWIAAPARSFVFDNDATGYWVTDTSYIHVHHHRRTHASMILGRFFLNPPLVYPPINCTQLLHPTMPAQRSHKKGKSKKSRDPPPPPPFRFQGARLAWLQPQINAFLMALHRGPLHTFLPDLYERYWKNFPWRLPIEEEPYPGMAFDDDLLELSTTERIQRDYVVARTNVREPLAQRHSAMRPVVLQSPRAAIKIFQAAAPVHLHEPSLPEDALHVLSANEMVVRGPELTLLAAAHTFARFGLLNSPMLRTIARLRLGARVAGRGHRLTAENRAQGRTLHGSGVGFGVGKCQSEVKIHNLFAYVPPPCPRAKKKPPSCDPAPFGRTGSAVVANDASRVPPTSRPTTARWSSVTPIPSTRLCQVVRRPLSPPLLARPNHSHISISAPAHLIPACTPSSKEAAAIAQRHPQTRADPDAVLLAGLAGGNKRTPPQADAVSESKTCRCPDHRAPRKKKLVATACVEGRDYVFEAVE